MADVNGVSGRVERLFGGTRPIRHQVQVPGSFERLPPVLDLFRHHRAAEPLALPDIPPDFNFLQTVHAANERIPVDALQFGVDAVYKLLTRYGTDLK